MSINQFCNVNVMKQQLVHWQAYSTICSNHTKAKITQKYQKPICTNKAKLSTTQLYFRVKNYKYNETTEILSRG